MRKEHLGHILLKVPNEWKSVIADIEEPYAVGSGLWEGWGVRKEQREAMLAKPQPRQCPGRKESSGTPTKLVVFKCLLGKCLYLRCKSLWTTGAEVDSYTRSQNEPWCDMVNKHIVSIYLMPCCPPFLLKNTTLPKNVHIHISHHCEWIITDFRCPDKYAILTKGW